jgi:hypothetical protein
VGNAFFCIALWALEDERINREVEFALPEEARSPGMSTVFAEDAC